MLILAFSFLVYYEVPALFVREHATLLEAIQEKGSRAFEVRRENSRPHALYALDGKRDPTE